MQDSKLKDRIEEILLSEGFTEIVEFIHPETIDNLLNLKLSNKTMIKEALEHVNFDKKAYGNGDFVTPKSVKEISPTTKTVLLATYDARIFSKQTAKIDNLDSAFIKKKEPVYLMDLLFHKKRNLIAEKFKEEGINIKDKDWNGEYQIPLRSLLLLNKDVYRLDNGLAYTDKYKTRLRIIPIFLDEIELATPLNQDIIKKIIEEKKRKNIELCKDCYECINSCPTSVLSKKGIDQQLCLVNIQVNPIYKNDKRNFFQKKIGTYHKLCNICQEVCPLNEKENRIKWKT